MFDWVNYWPQSLHTMGRPRVSLSRKTASVRNILNGCRLGLSLLVLMMFQTIIWTRSTKKFDCSDVDIDNTLAVCTFGTDFAIPSLSVYTTIKGDPDEWYLLPGFLDNVAEQKLSSWELIIATADKSTLERLNHLLGVVTLLHIKVVLFEKDMVWVNPGIYLYVFTKGPLLSNWNVDDRKISQFSQPKGRIFTLASNRT